PLGAIRGIVSSLFATTVPTLDSVASGPIVAVRAWSRRQDGSPFPKYHACEPRWCRQGGRWDIGIGADGSARRHAPCHPGQSWKSELRRGLAVLDGSSAALVTDGTAVAKSENTPCCERAPPSEPPPRRARTGRRSSARNASRTRERRDRPGERGMRVMRGSASRLGTTSRRFAAALALVATLVGGGCKQAAAAAPA